MKKIPNLSKWLITPSLAIGACLTTSLAGDPASSGKSPAKEVAEISSSFHPMYLGSFNTGIKTSDVYTDGHVSLVVPFWSSIGSDGTLGGGTLFLEPYVSLGEQGELATSVGLGWRYLFSDQPVSAYKSTDRAGFLTEGFYVGANVFVDNLTTEFDNDFWQLGLGAEIGTRYLEIRGNYYLPFDSDRKLASRTTSTQKFKSSSTSYHTTSDLSRFNASQHNLGHDLTLTTTATTTTRTTTVKTVTSLYEEGMEGWDVEAAFLIPGLDQYLDVSIIGGYYSFDNHPFGPQSGGTGKTEGWKLGLEVRPVPALVLTGTWYEDEGLTGSDWVVGAALQVPLGKEWKDAFKPRRRHLVERVAEPVARQNAAVKVARDVDQQSSQNTVTAVKRRVVKKEKKRIIIEDDLVFVNNGAEVGQGFKAGSNTGNGTAEKPVATIQAGADVAAQKNAETGRVWRVYTQGGIEYNENITISGSTRFIASNQIFTSPITGETFGTGHRARVNGGFAGDATTFVPGHTTPTYVGMTGYDIVNGHSGNSYRGIDLAGVESVEIFDNSFEGTGSAIFLRDSANLMAYVGYNTINNTIAGGGVHALQVDNVNTLTMSIGYNTIENIDDSGIHISANDITNIQIRQNTLTNTNSDGVTSGPGEAQGAIVVLAQTLFGDISDNTIDTSTGYGVYVKANSTTASQNLFVRSNNISNITLDDQGAGAGIHHETDNDMYTTIANNTVEFTEGHGIHLVVGGDITFGNIQYNIVHDIGATDGSNPGITNGIFIEAGNFSGSISYNHVTRVEDSGIRVQTVGDFTGSIVGNNSSNNNLDLVVTEQGGISLDIGGTFSGGGIQGGIQANVTNDNGTGGVGSGIYLKADTFIGDGVFQNNISNDNGTYGFRIDVNTVISQPLIVIPNSANGNGTANFSETNATPITQ